MVLLVLIIYLISIYILGSFDKVFIYSCFVFFWFFGFFRLEYFELFRGQDDDIEYLQSVIGILNLKGYNFWKLLFQMFFSNFIIVLFIKKLNFKDHSIIKTQSTFEYFDTFLSLVVFFFSVYLIRQELFSIVILGVSGYDVINAYGSNGGNYSLHVFLNRLSLLFLFASIIRDGSIKLHHGVVFSIFLLFYILTGQRNELFRFTVAIVFWLLSVKTMKFHLRYIFYTVLALLPLRMIELYRGGVVDFKELFVSSVTSISAPLFGAETIVPFYSWPSVLFYDIKHSPYNLLYWFFDSIHLTSSNALTTYSIYKDRLFPMEVRGLAINIIASLNIYVHWFLVVPLFALIIWSIYNILKFWKNSDLLLGSLSLNYRSVIYFWSFASIVLLGRNGIEGLRPLILHDFLIYPLIFLLISQVRTVKLRA